MTYRDRLAKEWPTMALFILAFYVLTLLAFIPRLGQDTLYRTLAQAIIITGLIGIALAYHYRGDQAKAEEIAALKKEIEDLRVRLGPEAHST